MKVECETCKKNIYKLKAYEICLGIIEVDSDGPGQWNGYDTLKGYTGDGLFCSLECIKKWIEKTIGKK